MPQHAGKKNDDQNSSARLVAVSESGNHLVSFFALTQIVFTDEFCSNGSLWQAEL
jgi:hypothetical protein